MKRIKYLDYISIRSDTIPRERTNDLADGLTNHTAADKGQMANSVRGSQRILRRHLLARTILNVQYCMFMLELWYIVVDWLLLF